MILKLWKAEPPFELSGEFWNLKITRPNSELGMGEMLRPYQKPHPPIAMSVIKSNSLAARTAGQRGYIPLSTNLVPASTIAEHWKVYCGAAKEAGLAEPKRSMWRVARSIYVGDSSSDAREHVLRGTFARSFQYMCTLMKSANMLHLVKHDLQVPDEEITPEYILKHLCIVGDPKECVRQLQELWQQTGGFGTLLMIAHDWDDKAKWTHSMELLTHKVLPALPNIFDPN